MKANSPTHQHIKSLIAKYTQNLENQVIVDYGCGSGALIEYLDLAKIKKYTGFDINQFSIQQAQKMDLPPSFQFKVMHPGKIPNLGRNNSADIIVLIGVWQYLSKEEQTDLLSSARKVLKKNGTIIISCAVGHAFYRFFNIYQLWLPHHYTSRPKIISALYKKEFKLVYSQEKGLLIAPLFSNVIAFIFDALDVILWRKKGTLGPVGEAARLLISPLIWLEFKLPIDLGYTLFLVGKK